jgi:hypothetical protein
VRLSHRWIASVLIEALIRAHLSKIQRVPALRTVWSPQPSLCGGEGSWQDMIERPQTGLRQLDGSLNSRRVFTSDWLGGLPVND